MTARTPGRPADVVVTGTGVVCAIGTDTASFGAALRNGRSGISAMPPGNGADTERQVGAFLPDLDLAARLTADAALPAAVTRAAVRAVGRSPAGLRAAAAAAIEAWCGARLHEAAIPADRIALVVAGNNLTGKYIHAMAARHGGNPAYLPGRYALRYQDTDHVGTLSQILGITGEGCTVGGASASGNVGIIHGSRLIELGAADACLVVGAMADLSAIERQAFINLGAMADWTPDTDPAALCRPFDTARQGFVYGQAAACLLLESMRSARRRAAEVLAGLSGYAQGLDANSLADPSAEGEARVMARAMARAGFRPADIDYVNTHGTGSPLGDATEVAALAHAFGPDLSRPLLNATKGLVGHCLCAAGVLEAVAVIIQMRQGFIHPNVNLSQPLDHRCRFAGGRSADAVIGRALSASFGFGGINTCIALATPTP